MKSKILMLSFFSLLIICTSGFAMPVLKKELTFSQSDGSTFVAIPYGDEWNNGYETQDGYTIIYDNTTGNWYYAESSTEGKLAPSKYLVGKHKPSVAKHLRDKNPKLNLSLELLQNAQVTAGPPVSASGTHKVLVILTQFSDRSLSTTETEWNLKFFSGVFSTVNDYFDETSYSNLAIVPAQESCGTSNDGIAIATLSYAHPNTGSSIGDTNRQLTKNALIAVDSCVNFSSFDTNSDGYISTNELHVVIIVAGYETSYGGASACTPNIWGHRWSLGGSVSSPILDGKSVANYLGNGGYTQFGEKHCASWDNPGHIATIGIIVHELGHDLWLPDEYDTDGSSSGIGDWGVMGTGSWNSCFGGYSGNCPSHPTAWDKWYLGWLSPVQISTTQSVNIPDITSNPTAFYLGNNPGGVDWSFNSNSGTGEYFMAENRQLTGYNTGLPSSGLLIWHIWEGAPYNNSANQNEAGRRLIDLREADGLNELDAGGSSDPGDIFPGSTGNSNFDNETNPSSKFYCITGTGFCDPSCISIKSISLSQPTMTANVSAQDCPGGGPQNDLCSNATVISGNTFSETISILNSSTESSDPAVTCGNGSRSKSVWYKYTPSVNGTIITDTFGSNYNTILSVYTGNCSSFTPLSCNDNSDGNQSQVIFHVTGGVTYYFMITSYDGAEGTLIFNLSFTPDLDGILSVSPSTNFDSQGNAGGPFNPASKIYTLTNSGDLSLDWTVSKTVPWLDISPTSGTLGDGESTQITVTINNNANTLTATTYSDTIIFTNTTNGNGNTTRTVTLTVSGSQNNPPTKPELFEPADKSVNLSTTVTFIWNESTDPDNDPVSYELYVCTDAVPEKCTPTQVSSHILKVYFAGVWNGIGIWILILISSLIAGFAKKLKIGILIIIILAGSNLTSCKKLLEGGDFTYTIVGLKTNTTYYWKVIAKDNREGKSDSDTWSFTTGSE